MASTCCCGCGCRLRACLVVVQVLIACGITGVSVFTLLCVPAIKLLETPVWAGAPFLLASLLSAVYCCRRSERRKKEGRIGEEMEDEDEDSTCLFIVKVMCIILLVISFIVCLIATVFCAVHVVKLFMYAFCVRTPNGCVCFQSIDSDSKSTEYFPVETCEEVFSKVKYTIMASGLLSLLGSVAALTFLAFIFRSRYGQIETGS
ncbi:sarcospan [Plakobranchus ocellatus]|uniref:Sarcospan n=1 Tax=Plakobranchus ocellatus TaxID=259542 RepID=A0AAV4AC27_9GAST|nr:sarcospan [Plakobranchus ocellatus]